MNETADIDPLDALFTDETYDRALLANAIKPYLSIHKDSGRVILNKAWQDLNLHKKILTVLLAKKVVALKSLGGEFMSPKDIEQETGIVGGSVRGTLSKLADDHFVEKSEDGYFIPDFKVNEVSNLILSDE